MPLRRGTRSRQDVGERQATADCKVPFLHVYPARNHIARINQGAAAVFEGSVEQFATPFCWGSLLRRCRYAHRRGSPDDLTAGSRWARDRVMDGGWVNSPWAHFGSSQPSPGRTKSAFSGPEPRCLAHAGSYEHAAVPYEMLRTDPFPCDLVCQPPSLYDRVRRCRLGFHGFTACDRCALGSQRIRKKMLRGCVELRGGSSFTGPRGARTVVDGFPWASETSTLSA